VGIIVKKTKVAKSLVACLIIAAITASGFTVFASNGSKTLTAYFNNIRIMVDGELIIPKDANGNEVEPFTVNGTTYLPVRAVANALGKDVTWDGSTQTVYIGQVPGKATYMFDVLNAYEVGGYGAQIEENASFNMLGESYMHGVAFTEVTWGMWSRDAETSASYNLKGQYKTIRGVIGHIDGAKGGDGTLRIDLDGKTYKAYTISSDMLTKEIAIDVTGVQLMKISINAGSDAKWGFGNVTIE